MKTRTVISLLLLTLGWGTALRAQVTLTGVMQTGNEDYAYYNTVVFLPDGSRAMVTDPLNSRVIVFDPRQYNQIITTVPTGLEPAGIYLSPGGLYACVLNIDSETVTIIRLSDYATATYTPPNPTAFGYWNNIAFSPDGNYGLVCNAYTNTPRVHVFRISVESSTLHQATLNVGQDPARIYMYGDRAYVVCTGGSSGDIISVLRYNGSSFSDTGNYTIAETDFDRPGTAGYTYNNIVFSTDGTTGYIGNPLYNEVIAFDLSNPNIQSYLDLSDETEASISRLAMSPDGLYLMATSIVTEQVFILDPASLDLLFTVEDSAGLLDIDAFNNIVSDIDGYTAYIASVGSDEIMHFDFTTGQPIEYIPAGSAPETLARSADGRFMTAVNVGQDIGDTVSIFSLHPKVINIPFFRTVAGEYTGYAVSNPSAEPLTMVAFANTSDGQTITGDNNPAIEGLSALNQLPFIGDQLFGLPAGEYLGWLQLICNNDAARAFFLSTNYEGDYMDGTVASDTLYLDFFLTHLREQMIQGQYRIKTELFFANPYSLPVELSLEVRDRNGTVLALCPRTSEPWLLGNSSVERCGTCFSAVSRHWTWTTPTSTAPSPTRVSAWSASPWSATWTRAAPLRRSIPCPCSCRPTSRLSTVLTWPMEARKPRECLYPTTRSFTWSTPPRAPSGLRLPCTMTRPAPARGTLTPPSSIWIPGRCTPMMPGISLTFPIRPPAPST